MNSEKELEFAPQSMPFPFMYNNTACHSDEGEIEVDDLIKQIDAKIAELEKEEQEE